MQQTAASFARGVGRILVAGADTDAFLQGQLTQDLRKLANGQVLLAGYCSAKGRLLAVLQLRREEAGVVLELHRSILEATLKRLRMFVLRSKVTLTELAPAVPEDADDRMEVPRDTQWRRDRIARGVPTIFPATSDHFVPQMCNLDLLGAISFDKGCYTGQEIVARLHYLGQVKRRMFRARVDAAVQTKEDHSRAEPGQEIFDAAQPAQAVGEVVDCIDGDALVVLQLAHAAGDLRIGSADGAPLRALTDLSASA